MILTNGNSDPALTTDTVKDLESYLVHLFKMKIKEIEPVELKKIVEKTLIISVMEANEYSQTKSAKSLGANRGTFRSKLKKHGLIGG